MDDQPHSTGETVHLLIPDSEQSTPSEIAAFRQSARALIQSSQGQSVSFQFADNENWNTLSLAVLKSLVNHANRAGAEVDYSQLPSGAVKILSLSKTPVTAEDDSHSEKPKFQLFFKAGESARETFSEVVSFLGFVFTATLSLIDLIRGKDCFQEADFKTFLYAAGPQAFVIVGIVNLLLGVIMAFMGAVQLQLFGAEIFVANLVALGHTREIAPMMTAIVLAGTTGAAYAAQLGTMQVNEEIDALTTFGFSPMDFLVLPRMLALALMTPLLVLYGDVIGLLGGYFIATTMLDIGTLEYFTQTRGAISINDIGLGIFKGSVFGVLVAIIGCREGMASGRSASAVGDAATRAVVNCILAIIVMTAVFSVLSSWLGL